MITLFQNGDEGSQGKLMAALTSLHSQGGSVLSSLDSARTKVLVDLERRLSALNARRQRANRCETVKVAGRLHVSDLLDIDQSQSTATVRIDTQSATLRERTTDSGAAIKSIRFSTDVGTVEEMGDLRRVHVEGVENPIGTFDVELLSPLNVSMLVIDMVPMPSDPVIEVRVSSNGVTYSDALNVTSNGYRVSAWLPQLEVRFIRVMVAPSHADEIGGQAYTFGITALNAAAVRFQLLSEVVSRTILINPASSQLCFKADADEGISFFLSIGNQPFVEVADGDIIDIPGAASQVVEDVAIDGTGKFLQSLPEGVYPSSLRVSDAGTGKDVPLAPGLAPNAFGIDKLTGKYVAVDGNDLYLVKYDAATDVARRFTLRFTSGPASLYVKLRAQLTTLDRAATPVFRGAAFEEI